MILLTGATGNVGSALLRRLTTRGDRVRCLVRDPRRLGPERVRVQISLGDLQDPGSFRHAMRGVKTVIHLAAPMRDQHPGSIEELNGVATYRLMRAAERAGAERFVFFSAMGATEHAPTRFFRAKALAERAVAQSNVPSTVFAPSIVYSPDNYWVRLMERLTLLPAVPISGSGTAKYQPIWAEDVVDCVLAALERDGDRSSRYELAGPETLTYDDMARLVLPLLVRTARAGFEQVTRRYEQIAETLGAGPWRVFSTISLPLASRNILAGSLLGFSRALGEFGATIVVAGSIPGRTRTLAVGIYTYTETGQDRQAALLLVVSISIAFAAVLLSNRLARESR